MHNTQKYTHAQHSGSAVRTQGNNALVCVFPFLMKEFYLISADMFFLKGLFISHPAPSLNTSLIVPIDCSVPAMRSRSTLTYGLMFDCLSVWQPMPMPCYSSFAVSQSQALCFVFVIHFLKMSQ